MHTAWGTGTSAPSAREWDLLGYNVCYFGWGPFADDTPTAGQDKVWAKGRYPSKEKNILTYKDSPWGTGKTVKYSDDVPSHSITEIYAAYYIDLFLREEYTGSEIRLFGHSLGGQLNIALLNYLIYFCKSGGLPAAILPDRVTLLDPYFADTDSSLTCAWSGEIMNGGSMKKGYETALSAASMGILIEELRTSPFVGMAASLGKTEYYEEYKKFVMYSRIDTSFFTSIYKLTTAIDRMHVVSIYWYEDMLNMPYLYEEGSKSIGLSPYLNKDYAFGRIGNSYEIDLSNTEKNLTDDKLTSDIKTSIICGFTFEDSNSDGIYNERIHKQLANIKISLLDQEENFLDSFTTNNNGFFSFEVSPNTLYKIVSKDHSNYIVGNYEALLLKTEDDKDLVVCNLPFLPIEQEE